MSIQGSIKKGDGRIVQNQVPSIDISASREAHVGRLLVRRALPRRERRTVGAWCFADHMGPIDVTTTRGVDVGPHPHMGLQTVTWLIEGTQMHRDSLGSEQLISAGELNLMTAGRGIAHSEEATGSYEGRLQGIQLWVAQPEATRNGPPSFDHYADLPRFEHEGGFITLLIGTFQGVRSPATVATPLIGMDLDLRSTLSVDLDPLFEYGIVVLDGGVRVDGAVLTPGHFGFCSTGRDLLRFEVLQPTRAMLLGGVPFDEPIEMWWNFVGRSREEFIEAYSSWAKGDGRFGTVLSALERITTTLPPPQRARVVTEVLGGGDGTSKGAKA